MADRLAAARGALRREAGHARRDHRRHDWRHRSDQGGARRAAAGQRAGDALRPAAARQSRACSRSTSCPTSRGKIQVGLFNILQEGDVQIKGFPVRLPLDVMVLFTANPEDYTARGKIITPLKDRIGAEIRTHYMDSREQAMAITAQEAWVTRDQPVEVPRVRARDRRGGGVPGAQRTQDRQALRASASACRSASSRASSPTPSGARSRTTRRRWCRAPTDLYAVTAVDDGQVRARVRRRAQGRRPRRTRARARGGLRACSTASFPTPTSARWWSGSISAAR